jgi:cytochrome c oxidase subunit IV
MTTQTEHAETAHGTGEHAHPGPREYVKIAIWLGIATALEISLYYIEQAELMPDAPIIILLLFFMFVKFVLVAFWFMHLKFDSKLFSRLFYVGIVVALAVYTAVLAMFGIFVRG